MSLEVQMPPELVEVNKPVPPAISFVPSADAATEYQWSKGALVGAQLAPELVEIKIKPGTVFELSYSAAAIRVVPFADEATLDH
jgi:hypothetical protein